MVLYETRLYKISTVNIRILTYLVNEHYVMLFLARKGLYNGEYCKSVPGQNRDSNI
jgi:hypothetical protein